MHDVEIWTSQTHGKEIDLLLQLNLEADFADQEKGERSPRTSLEKLRNEWQRNDDGNWELYLTMLLLSPLRASGRRW